MKCDNNRLPRNINQPLTSLALFFRTILQVSFFTPRPVWPRGIAIASICPSVGPSVHFLLVHSITFERTHLESPNLVYRCILGSSRMGLHMVTFDLDLQGHLGRKRSKLAKYGLVHAITFEGLYQGPPNMAVMCILDSSRMGLHMLKFDLDLQGHLGRKRSKLAKNRLVHSITFEGL